MKPFPPHPKLTHRMGYPRHENELLESIGGGANGLAKDVAEKLPLANNETELADVLASAGIRLDEEKLAKVKKLFERPDRAAAAADVKGSCGQSA